MDGGDNNWRDVKEGVALPNDVILSWGEALWYLCDKEEEKDQCKHDGKEMVG